MHVTKRLGHAAVGTNFPFPMSDALECRLPHASTAIFTNKAWTPIDVHCAHAYVSKSHRRSGGAGLQVVKVDVVLVEGLYLQL